MQIQVNYSSGELTTVGGGRDLDFTSPKWRFLPMCENSTVTCLLRSCHFDAWKLRVWDSETWELLCTFRILHQELSSMMENWRSFKKPSQFLLGVLQNSCLAYPVLLSKLTIASIALLYCTTILISKFSLVPRSDFNIINQWIKINFNQNRVHLNMTVLNFFNVNLIIWWPIWETFVLGTYNYHILWC